MKNTLKNYRGCIMHSKFDKILAYSVVLILLALLSLESIHSANRSITSSSNLVITTKDQVPDCALTIEPGGTLTINLDTPSETVLFKGGITVEPGGLLVLTSGNMDFELPPGERIAIHNKGTFDIRGGRIVKMANANNTKNPNLQADYDCSELLFNEGTINYNNATSNPLEINVQKTIYNMGTIIVGENIGGGLIVNLLCNLYNGMDIDGNWYISTVNNVPNKCDSCGVVLIKGGRFVFKGTELKNYGTGISLGVQNSSNVAQFIVSGATENIVTKNTATYAKKTTLSLHLPVYFTGPSQFIIDTNEYVILTCDNGTPTIGYFHMQSAPAVSLDPYADAGTSYENSYNTVNEVTGNFAMLSGSVVEMAGRRQTLLKAEHTFRGYFDTRRVYFYQGVVEKYPAPPIPPSTVILNKYDASNPALSPGPQVMGFNFDTAMSPTDIKKQSRYGRLVLKDFNVMDNSWNTADSRPIIIGGQVENAFHYAKNGQRTDFGRDLIFWGQNADARYEAYSESSHLSSNISTIGENNAGRYAFTSEVTSTIARLLNDVKTKTSGWAGWYFWSNTMTFFRIDSVDIPANPTSIALLKFRTTPETDPTYIGDATAWAKRKIVFDITKNASDSYKYFATDLRMGFLKQEEIAHGGNTAISPSNVNFMFFSKTRPSEQTKEMIGFVANNVSFGLTPFCSSYPTPNVTITNGPAGAVSIQPGDEIILEGLPEPLLEIVIEKTDGTVLTPLERTGYKELTVCRSDWANTTVTGRFPTENFPLYYGSNFYIRWEKSTTLTGTYASVNSATITYQQDTPMEHVLQTNDSGYYRLVVSASPGFSPTMVISDTLHISILDPCVVMNMDTVVTLINTPAVWDVMAGTQDGIGKDIYPAGATLYLKSPLTKKGTVSITADNKIRYMPRTGEVGLDTFRYYIKGTDNTIYGSNVAKEFNVIIWIYNLKATKYFACDGDIVRILCGAGTDLTGNKINNQGNWNSPGNGGAQAYWSMEDWNNKPNSSYTYIITKDAVDFLVPKDNDDMQIGYVQAKIAHRNNLIFTSGPVEFPTVPVTLTLAKELGCDEPNAQIVCADSSTLKDIFTEDFETAPQAWKAGGGVENWIHNNNNSTWAGNANSNNYYRITTAPGYNETVIPNAPYTEMSGSNYAVYSAVRNPIQTGSIDRTNPNAAYKATVPIAFCNANKISVHFYVAELNKPGNTSHPVLLLTIWDPNHNDLDHKWQRYIGIRSAATSGQWYHTGIELDVPVDMTDLSFSIESIGEGNSISYFALEDVKVTVCEADVEIITISDVIGCSGQEVVLEAEYTSGISNKDQNYEAQWLESINGGTTWTPVGNAEIFAGNDIPKDLIYTVPASKAIPGTSIHYRISVKNIITPDCIVYSDTINITYSNSLELEDFFVSVIDGQPATTDISTQANLESCDSKTVTLVNSTNGTTANTSISTTKGNASVDANGVITYTPNAGAVGIDTFDYQVVCNSEGCSHISTGKVYVYIYELQQEYYGCYLTDLDWYPAAQNNIKMSVKSDAITQDDDELPGLGYFLESDNMRFRWYFPDSTTQQGDDAWENFYDHTMTDEDEVTYYVAAVYDLNPAENIDSLYEFAKIPITIRQGDCEIVDGEIVPEDCYLNGAVMAQDTNVTKIDTTWNRLDKNEAKRFLPFLSVPVDNAIAGTQIAFSFWLDYISEEDPDVMFYFVNLVVEVVDEDSNMIASFRTGNIDLTPEKVTDKLFFGFKTNVATTGPLTFNVYNETYADGGIVDPVISISDITIRNCYAPVIITPETGIVCENSELSIEAKYVDIVGFEVGGRVQTRWEKSDDNITWTTINNTNDNIQLINDTITSVYTLGYVTAADIGYYRFVVIEDPAATEEVIMFSNVYYIGGVEQCIIANDDNGSTFGSWELAVDVKANDTVTINAPCVGADATEKRDSAIVEIVTQGSKGNADVVDGKAVYTNFGGATNAGEDSFTYRICCGNVCDTAIVNVYVYPFPDNVTDACNLPATAFEWGIADPIIVGTNEDASSWSNTKKRDTDTGRLCLEPYQPVLVGDLDGDKQPELVVPASNECYGYTLNGNDLATGAFYIFKLINEVWEPQFVELPSSGGHYRFSINRAKGTIGLAEGKIIIATSRGYLLAFDVNGNNLWRSDDVYSYQNPGNHTSSVETSIMFANFTGKDNETVIVTHNKIWNMDGKLLLNIPGLVTSQTRFSSNGYTPASSNVAIADVDNDGIPEYIWGGNVYDINLPNMAGPAGNNATLRTSSSVTNPPIPNDRRYITTIPADFNKDGQVEVLVYSTTDNWEANMDGNAPNNPQGTATMYIYEPRAGATVKAVRNIDRFEASGGMPFVGDVDNNGIPEIMIGQGAKRDGYSLYAYDIDLTQNSANAISVRWNIETGDDSRMTGLTLFDFAQSGSSEIVYRDEDSLWIINGDDGTKLRTFPGQRSGTGTEYPVVADIDQDGEAEIVIVSHPVKTGLGSHAGELYIFKAGKTDAGVQTKWAPARPVWNQYNYNVVNINEDLTVPTRMFNVAQIMPGEDGAFGTPDDIQPFNGFLKQGTSISQNGTQLMLAGDLDFTDGQGGDKNININWDPVKGSVTVTMTVYNNGAARIIPININIYRDDVQPTVLIYDTVCNEALHPGTSKDFVIEVPYDTIAKYRPVNRLHVELNPSGAEQVPECDYTNNTSDTMPFKMLMARNDTLIAASNIQTLLNVLNNDDYTDCGAEAISIDVIEPPTLGNIISTNSAGITYMPTLWSYGIDSLTYKITCGDSLESTAKVYIFIYMPESQRYYACPGQNIEVQVETVEDVVYSWVDQNGNSIDGQYTESVWDKNFNNGNGQPQGAWKDTTMSTTSGNDNERYVVDNTKYPYPTAVYVQATWTYVLGGKTNTITFPPSDIHIALGSCGDTLADGCYATGTVLFKEDFGGGHPQAPRVRSIQQAHRQASAYVLPEEVVANWDAISANQNLVSYDYSGSGVGGGPDDGCTGDGNGGSSGGFADPLRCENMYQLAKVIYSDNGTQKIQQMINGVATEIQGPWYIQGDHTTLGDNSTGYMLAVNASETPGLLYRHQIDSLCEGVELSFSVWAASLMTWEGTHKPNLTLRALDPAGNVLATYRTGNIPDRDSTWKLYGFSFRIEDETSVVFEIYNNSQGSDGADYKIDDIEIRVCYPEVNITYNGNNTACIGDALTINASSTFPAGYDNPFVSMTKFILEKLDTTQVPGEWVPQTSLMVDAKTTVDTTFLITNAATGTEAGFYRVRIGGSDNLGFENGNSKCVAVSDVLEVTINGCGYAMSARSGRWSDPETWQSHTVPTKTDNVRIKDGHVVYTGATARAFEARAYGRGANALDGTIGIDKQEGKNEDELTGQENLIDGTNIIKLANSVTIEEGGTLIIAQLDTLPTDGWQADLLVATIEGANDLQTYRFDFGPITNNSWPIPNDKNSDWITHERATAWYILKFNIPSNGDGPLRGLFIVAEVLPYDSTAKVQTFDTLAQATTQNWYAGDDGSYPVPEFSITNNGFMYVHGVFNTENIKNTGRLKQEHGIVSVSGNFENTGSDSASFRMVRPGWGTGGWDEADYKREFITIQFGVKGKIVNDGEFIVNAGKFIHKANGTPANPIQDTIYANKPIIITALGGYGGEGGFVIDRYRHTALKGAGGIEIDRVPDYGRAYVGRYYAEETAGADPQTATILAQFAVLAGAELEVYDKGLTDNAYNLGGVFFNHRPKTSGNNPEDLNIPISKVIYHDSAVILSNTPDTPYGILELAADHQQTQLMGLGYYKINGNIYIAGYTENALIIKHTNNIRTYIPNSSTVFEFAFVTPVSQISFGSNTQEIDGVVARVNSKWFEPATTSGKEYKFNNEHTKLTFSGAGDNMNSFKLYVSPGSQANCAYSNDDRRVAQREVRATFDIKDWSTPRITNMSIGYIGGTEVIEALFDKRLIFGEGYHYATIPASWGIAKKPDILENFLQPYTYTGNIPLVPQNPPSHNGVLASYSDIVLYASRIETVRSGRWSDPATWHDGVVPGMDEDVTIAPWHKVYTGATTQAFGARAYGKGANALNGTVGLDKQEGLNETDLTGHTPAGAPHVIKLANSVTIGYGGALVISQLNNITGMTAGTASASGANDLRRPDPTNPTVVLGKLLDFGQIINYDATAEDQYRYRAGIGENTQCKILDKNITYADRDKVRGLIIIYNNSTSNDTLGQATTKYWDSTVTPKPAASIINNGYMYVHGIFNTESIDNRGDIVVESGALSVAGDLKNLTTANPSKFIMSIPAWNTSNALDGTRRPHVNVTGDIIAPTNSVFTVGNGKLIHRANGSNWNTIQADTKITVSGNGGISIEAGRLTELKGNGGIEINTGHADLLGYNNGGGFPLYAYMEDGFPTFVAVSAKVQLAVLHGATLSVYDKGIVDNVMHTASTTNMFFSTGTRAGASRIAKPSTVIYNDNASILQTYPNMPYGILELAGNHNQQTLTGDIYIAGKSENALHFKRNTDINTGSYRFVMMAPTSNVFFETDNEIIGRVARISQFFGAGPTVIKPTFGYAIQSDKPYTFNNKHTILTFADAVANVYDNATTDNLRSFALTVQPGTGPNCNSSTDYVRRAQRKVTASFTIPVGATKTTKLYDISVGYIVGNVPNTEVIAELFDGALLIGEGYNLNNAPSAWGIPGKPQGSTGLQPFTWLNTIPLVASVTGSHSNVLASGSDIVLFKSEVFASMRAGRWSDPEVWSTKMVPTVRDSVIIRHIIYTGLWDGLGNANGSAGSLNDLFGARPYGRAESGINFNQNTMEAILAGRVRIVEPNRFSVPGEQTPLPPGPSALLICAYQQGNESLPTAASGTVTDYVLGCEQMDWQTTLVFNSDEADFGNADMKAIRVEAAGSETPVYSTLNATAFLEKAKTDTEWWKTLKGLYLISFEGSDDIPMIRALNIENNGLIQNEGIINIGDSPAVLPQPTIAPKRNNNRLQPDE